MSDYVHASAEDIRKLAGSLNAFKKDVSDATRKVHGALGQARWHDQRKDQFELRLGDLRKKIDGFMSQEVDGMVKTLMELAVRLDAIKNVKM